MKTSHLYLDDILIRDDTQKTWDTDKKKYTDRILLYILHIVLQSPYSIKKMFAHFLYIL